MYILCTNPVFLRSTWHEVIPKADGGERDKSVVNTLKPGPGLQILILVGWFSVRRWINSYWEEKSIDHRKDRVLYGLLRDLYRVT